jgi:uncharacterized caspase-like protein
MKKLITCCLLLSFFGCVRFHYEAKEELGKRTIESSMLSKYDLTIGIQFKDTAMSESTKDVEGDLALETAEWLANFLAEGNNFKKVVNLNKNKDEEVDVILRGIIKSIDLQEEGISATSKALGIFYGVAPIVEHYAARKQVQSSATIKFQLIEPKNRIVLWDQVITEKTRDLIQLSRSSKLIFASIAKTVETLLGESKLPEELNRMSQKIYISDFISTPRRQHPEATPTWTHRLGERWAVVIGISKFQDSRIPSLRYGSKDAQAFYDWLTSPDGGKYAPSRVTLLLDQQATGQNIRNALFSWLRQALEEDVVTIYFAGHGSPESPDSPENLFLLPYDTKYDNVAGTGFPMWDIETALKRFIKAKKVIVIADACHAGGVGQAFDVSHRASRSIRVNPISSGFQNLTRIGDGVCVISASDERQLSQESKDWGGGHGVFTYHLLKGLEGEADYNKDTRVNLGELIPYLSEQVRRATRNAQSPTVAGKFDPALSIGR